MKSLITFSIACLLVLPSLAAAAPVQCECVRYLRQVMDVNVRGDAWTLPVNTSMLNIDEGDVLLIGKNHAALVIGFEGEGIIGNAIGPRFIWITDSNYVGSCKPSTRKIAWDDIKIRGVYHPDTPL